ncbi:uncharacterized protein RJT20DRAFT_31081 [Scheffersomyces xylosifermentans]|uniref:uncharacterized protein n=1 Tax=Scheffersomyces xylosifermentans TaxID=1304137 RepID=UPI00315D99EF
MTKHSYDNYPWKLQYDSALNQYYYMNTEDGSVTFDMPCEVSHTPSINSSMSKHGFLSKLKRSASSSVCPLNTDMKKRDSASGSVLSKIGTALSLKSSKSRDSSISSESSYEARRSSGSIYTPNNTSITTSVTSTDMHSAAASSTGYLTETSVELQSPGTIHTASDVSSVITGLDDEFLLNNLTNFKNFAGTSMVATAYNSDEEASIDSMEQEEEEEEEEEEVQSFFDYTYIRNGDSQHYYYNEEEDDEEDQEMYNVDKELERRELRLQILKDFY